VKQSSLQLALVTEAIETATVRSNQKRRLDLHVKTTKFVLSDI